MGEWAWPRWKGRNVFSAGADIQQQISADLVFNKEQNTEWIETRKSCLFISSFKNIGNKANELQDNYSNLHTLIKNCGGGIFQNSESLPSDLGGARFALLPPRNSAVLLLMPSRWLVPRCHQSGQTRRTQEVCEERQ